MVASVSKKSGKSPLSKRSGLKTTLKGVKDDRAARMKAARDAYSKLSLERAKHSDTSHKPGPSAKSSGPPTRAATTTNNENDVPNRNAPPSPSRTFKPMASSLDMIRNNRVRIPTVGRASSIAGARSLGPRPSLLPLGINVFESNVSVTDQQKVREFLENVAHTGKTPKKPLRSFDSSEALLSSSRGRTVRFIEATISEQRESGSDELIEESPNRPSTSVPEQSTASGTVPTPQSILKKKTKSPVFRRPPSPKATLHEPTATPTLRRRSLRSAISAVVPDPPRLLLSFASSTDSDESLANVRNKAGSGDQQSDFVRSYTMLFNMKDEEWRNVEPIMLTELIELFQNKKEMIDKEAALMPLDSSCSLMSLPDSLTPCIPKKVGFRRVSSKAGLSNTELQANQEVMLLNESAQQRLLYEQEIAALPRQLRQRNPVSKTLDGESPFYPIRGSPCL